MGALAYTLIYPVLKTSFLSLGDFGKVTLASSLGIPGLIGAIALAVVLVAIVSFVPTVVRPDSVRGAARR